MALPENRLSSQAFPAAFTGGRALSASPQRDFETGGIALSDPSQGHLVQVWKAEVVDNSTIVISNEAAFEVSYYSDHNVTEVSLTFDQNMRPAIALVADGQAKLIWYDAQAAQEVVTELDADVRSPRVSLDDKRASQSALNDIILGYIRGRNLYHRLQRDRFEVEYLLAENVVPTEEWYLRRMGMNAVNRFQFEIFRDWNQEEILADMLPRAAAVASEGPYTPAAAAVTTFDLGSSTIYNPDNSED